MWDCRAYAMALVAWLAFGCASAPAGKLSDFGVAVEKASTHYRVAMGYLRVGNTDLAASELDDLRKSWLEVVERFGSTPPDAFENNALYGTTLADVNTRIASALKLLDGRKPDAAREALLPIRSSLSQLRRTSGLFLLPDCILDANAAMDDLFRFKDTPPDWSKPETRFDIASKATVYAHELKRCDGIAPGQIRADPQFRRLVDGALAALALVPKVISTRDSELLTRILVELRSFDNLLAFRFG